MGGDSWRPVFLDLSFVIGFVANAVARLLHGFWYAFGAHDGYNLWEAPDNVSMAATVLAIGAGGALSSVETTVLLSVEDTLAALNKASAIKYRPPGTKA